VTSRQQRCSAAKRAAPKPGPTSAEAAAILRGIAAQLGRGEEIAGGDLPVRAVRLLLLRGCAKRDLPAPIIAALRDMTAALDDFTSRLPKATARNPLARRCLRDTDAPELTATLALLNHPQRVEAAVCAVDACTAAYRDAARKMSGSHGRR
jgi:hypothetical protein